MEAEGDFGDDAEGAVGADHEFVEVVAGDVLDDLAAGAGDGPVGEDDGHADDQVAEAAVLEADGAGVVGGEDAADGSGLGPERVECDELVVGGEGALHRGPGGSGADGGGEILPAMFADSGEAGGVEEEVRGDGISPGALGAGAGDLDGEFVGVGVAGDGRDFLSFIWGEDWLAVALGDLCGAEEFFEFGGWCHRVFSCV